MDIEKLKQELKTSVKWSQKRPPETGGQSCGMPNYPIVLTCEELDFEISLGYYKSSLKNKNLAFLLFELALDELIK